MDLRTEIEIEVPDELQGRELVKWIHKEYYGLLSGNHVSNETAAAPLIPKFDYNRKDELTPDQFHGTSKSRLPTDEILQDLKSRYKPRK